MTTRFLAIVATAIYFACAVIPASAQGLSGVAVIDVLRLQRESAASKSIKAQIEKQYAVHQQEITKQENELRSAEQELNRQRTLVSPEAFAERRRQFEQKVANLQRDVQNRKSALDKSAMAAQRIVEQSLSEIVQQLVTERKLTLVLGKNTTIFAAPEFEITDEVMKRLNAKLPSVKVPPPAPAAAAPSAAPGAPGAPPKAPPPSR
jgi:Skp family chaperone for outer membrane proteins